MKKEKKLKNSSGNRRDCKNFNSMAKSITEENTIDNVNSAYLQESENPTTLPIAVTAKDSKDYPKGF